MKKITTASRAFAVNDFLPLVNDGFYAPYRQIKFLCQRLIAYTIYHAPVHDLAVTFVRYPFIDKKFHITAGYFREFHLRRFLVPLLPDFVLLRFRE